MFRLFLCLALFATAAASVSAQCRCGPDCDCGPACDCNVLRHFQPTAAPGEKTPGRLLIHAPADSTVELNGVKMQCSGPCHYFETPPLEHGEYCYTITLRAGDWTMTTRATIHPGETTTLRCPGCGDSPGNAAGGQCSALVSFGQLTGGCASGSCGAGGCANGQCGVPASRGFRRR